MDFVFACLNLWTTIINDFEDMFFFEGIPTYSSHCLFRFLIRSILTLIHFPLYQFSETEYPHNLYQIWLSHPDLHCIAKQSMRTWCGEFYFEAMVPIGSHSLGVEVSTEICQLTPIPKGDSWDLVTAFVCFCIPGIYLLDPQRVPGAGGGLPRR